jgi:photosystem II stability/assembly factor-like uncharacterized protein
MATRTAVERRRIALPVSAVLVWAACVAGPSATAAPPVAQPCTEFAVSPAFASDRTAFCVGEVRDPTTGNTTGLTFFRTSDGGRTWQPATAAGLTASGSNVLRDLVVSPRYADDGAVFVQLPLGLYVTTDRGESFLPADPLAWGRVTPYVAGPPVELPADAASHTLFAHALRGDVEGANKSTVIDPTTRARTPVKGSPGLDWEFAISPRFATDGLAYVIAEHGLGLTRHVRLYGCSVALECSAPLYRWPARWTFDRLWLAGDYSTSRTMFASVRALSGTPTLWRSRDGGRTFARWTAAERLPGVATGNIGLAPVGKQLYLRISGNGGDKATSPPYEQLFWSRDNGATWTRVSYGRLPIQPGARGSMPPASVNRNEDAVRGMVTAVGGGKVFILGSSREGANRYESMWCTADNGRTWARSCSR